MSDDHALVPVGPASAVGPRGCPRCGQAIALGPDDLAGRRTRCPSCAAGLDVVAVRSPGDGPLRSFHEVTLVADAAPPPEGIVDQSGGRATRRVVVTSGEKRGSRLFFQIAGIFAPLLIVIGEMVEKYPLFVVLYGALGAWELFSAASQRREDVISIEDGHLVVRYRGTAAPQRRIELSRVRDVEVASNRWRGLRIWIRSRLPWRRRVSIAAGLDRSPADLQWLRDHLRAGLATARDDRGLPAPADRKLLPPGKDSQE